ERLRRSYDAWFDDVGRTRGYDPPRIVLGTPRENPTILTRQDWRVPPAGSGREGPGHWEVDVAEPGHSLVARRAVAPRSGPAHFRFGAVARETTTSKDQKEIRFESVALPSGPGRLEAWIEAGERVGVRFVEIERAE